MMHVKNRFIYLFVVSACVICSCRKTIEKTVEVNKKNSWTESNRFSGADRIFLSSVSTPDAIYLQQPFDFTEVRNLDVSNGITVNVAGLPTDIRKRIPISPDFFAYPANNDTLLAVRNTKYPVTNGAVKYYEVTLFDPLFKRIQTDNYVSLSKCMAINNQGTLLFYYDSKRPDAAFTFLAIQFTTAGILPSIDTVFSRKIVIPRRGITYEYVRFITAIDNYFLVDIGDNGFYKIEEDGSFKKVYESPVVNTAYQWNNRIYAHAAGNTLLISDDNAESWQQYSGTAPFMSSSQYFIVKDSLVGASGGNLFTLRYNGNDYSTTSLQNDGLENTTINGIELLHDTVYAAITSGLFYKPLSAFFNAKQ